VIATIRTIAADGAETGARTAGDSGPALVFVHGVGSTAAIWDSQLEFFSGDYRCLAIELRGNGAFLDPDPALITRQGFAQDVVTVTQLAGVDRFTLIGCSLGGVVAFELWKEAPRYQEAMVIVGSFAKYPNGQAYADGIEAALDDAGTMAVFAAQRAAKLAMPPDRERETIEQMAGKSNASYRASTQATWTGDYRDVLPTIGVPVLVGCGERDVIAPMPLSEEIARGIPGAQLFSVPRAGHVANADAPEAFNAAVQVFLDAVRTTQR
jgi:3-oxoadipate enol-lactonase